MLTAMLLSCCQWYCCHADSDAVVVLTVMLTIMLTVLLLCWQSCCYHAVSHADGLVVVIADSHADSHVLSCWQPCCCHADSCSVVIVTQAEFWLTILNVTYVFGTVFYNRFQVSPSSIVMLQWTVSCSWCLAQCPATISWSVHIVL